MATELANLSAFLRAVFAEFLHEHPEIRARYHYWLGTRIQQAQTGQIQEVEYIEKWKRVLGEDTRE